MSTDPIPMILFCPQCGFQHIDAPSEGWSNPDHKSHLCGECHHVWRPADVCTNGVAEIGTNGVKDEPAIRGRAHGNGRSNQLETDINFIIADLDVPSKLEAWGILICGISVTSAALIHVLSVGLWPVEFFFFLTTMTGITVGVSAMAARMRMRRRVLLEIRH